MRKSKLDNIEEGVHVRRTCEVETRANMPPVRLNPVVLLQVAVVQAFLIPTLVLVLEVTVFRLGFLHKINLALHLVWVFPPD